ncbi:peptidyl-prolyl cis-trans isomerase CYP59, partial [Tanacetum coccineum]
TKYYNGCLFHTVQKDFTAQTGDPTGTGTGGDSIYKFLYGDQARFFGDEIHLDLKHTKMGTVAMANAGENLNASQFYITLRDDLDYLDGKKTVFGEVVEGLETLARINEAYVDDKNRPYKNIRIKHTYILDDPFEDPPQLAEHIPDASPEGKPKDEVDDEVRLEDDWVPLDEQLDANELEEVIRAKEAHSRAVVLETIGDLPEAEVKPPDNVLFVCKLNPVTEDDDLNTIFSRFGTVTSAEIIRDFKTGDSLCYAFIEFEDKEACEQAYFKMDNALIDDRRIHVDFSQSVSKLWNQFRSKGKHGGTAGKGCFKCGSLDHIARDCTGSPDAKRAPKYTLKDDGFTRKGGNDSSRYDMVFDEETGANSPRKKQPRQHCSWYDMVFDEETGANSQRKKQPRQHESDDRYEQRKVSHRAIDERKQMITSKGCGIERRKRDNRRDDDRLYRVSDDDRRRGIGKRYSEDMSMIGKKNWTKENMRYNRKIRDDDVGHNKKSRGEDRDGVNSFKVHN